MSVDLNQYPIFAPATRANPQPLYARMRAEAPIYRAVGPQSGRGFWLLTRYDDCVNALKDPRLGRSEERRGGQECG